MTCLGTFRTLGSEMQRQSGPRQRVVILHRSRLGRDQPALRTEIVDGDHLIHTRLLAVQ
jgi:hypothetical protein